MHVKNRNNWGKMLVWLAVIFIAAAFFCLAGCDEEEETSPGGELLPVFPDIIFSDEVQEGDEITGDMIPPGGLVGVEENATLDPDVQFQVSKSARTIRRIAKQDVYGRQLSDDFYYYRNALSTAEKLLYDQIYANCVDNDPAFNIQSKVSGSRAIPILTAVLFDNPDLFWVDPFISYSYGSDGFIAAVTLRFNECSKNLDAFKKVFYDCADSVLEQAMKLDNDALKVKYIHDVLTYINMYDGRAPLNQSAYSAVVNRKTVCAGYAAAFTYYMQRLGIPSLIVEGIAGENHAWNLVKLYGEYYEMDITWDDPLGNPSNKFYYDYFNITTNEINKDRYRNRISASNVPIANGTRYSYPAFFRNSPGSNFSSLSYGKPSRQLPQIYPGAGAPTTPAAATPPAATPAATTPAATTPAATTLAATLPTVTGAQQPQITIVNNTGYRIQGVYISPSTDDKWGTNKLGASERLENGQAYNVKLPFAINTVNKYDIALEDTDEDTYTKMDVVITANARIVFTFDDYDGDSSSTTPASSTISELRVARDYISRSMREWGQCRIAALTQTNGNIAIYSSNGYAGRGLPAGLPARLQQIANARDRIEDIHISESGGWLVVTGNNVYWERIDAELENKIREAGRNRETVLSATFNDKGDWILVTNSTFSSSSSDIQKWLLNGYNRYGSLVSANISEDGVIAVRLERGYWLSENAPGALVNALNSTRLAVKHIKTCGDAWFFADNNGNYSCSL